MEYPGLTGFLELCFGPLLLCFGWSSGTAVRENGFPPRAGAAHILTFSAWLPKVGSLMPSHSAETEALQPWQALRAFPPRRHPVKVARLQPCPATVSMSASSLSFVKAERSMPIDHTLLTSSPEARRPESRLSSAPPSNKGSICARPKACGHNRRIL